MRFHIYKDSAQEWRWNLKAANSRVLADSGEGYSSEQGCRDDIDRVKASKDTPIAKD